MMRPPPTGPRSVMVTTTWRPFSRFVTLTFVPRGSVLCAALRPYMLYRTPEAVALPWKSRPYHEAMPFFSPAPPTGRWEHPAMRRREAAMRVMQRLFFQVGDQFGDERGEGFFVSKLVPFVEDALCAQGVEGAFVHGQAQRLVPVYLALLVDP
jgi:hypothetical protein